MASIGGMGNLLKQAQEMQARMAKIQEELGQKTVEGSAGGGMVQVTVNGQFNLVAVKIEPSVINGSEKEMLEDRPARRAVHRNAARVGVHGNEQTHRRLQNSRFDAVMESVELNSKTSTADPESAMTFAVRNRQFGRMVS